MSAPCPDCDGTGVCDYVDDGGPDTCDTCHGEGRYAPRERTDAELRADDRFLTRLLYEPMYEVAVRFLLDARIKGTV